MSEFSNRVVLVTGAAGALGKAVVENSATGDATVAQLDVVPIDRFPRRPSSHRLPGVEFLRQSLVEELPIPSAGLASQTVRRGETVPQSLPGCATLGTNLAYRIIEVCVAG